MFYRKLFWSAMVLTLALAVSVAAFASSIDKTSNNQKKTRVSEPINLAILIQDDLTSQVSNELGVTSDFIRSLPSGSRVMVGYITTGTLQVLSLINISEPTRHAQIAYALLCL
jgi:hypothetical protein